MVMYIVCSDIVLVNSTKEEKKWGTGNYCQEKSPFSYQVDGNYEANDSTKCYYWLGRFFTNAVRKVYQTGLIIYLHFKVNQATTRTFLIYG